MDSINVEVSSSSLILEKLYNPSNFVKTFDICLQLPAARSYNFFHQYPGYFSFNKEGAWALEKNGLQWKDTILFSDIKAEYFYIKFDLKRKTKPFMFDPDNSRRDFIKENRKEIQENARENVRCTQQKIHFPRHNNYEAA